jgi:uncharacterized protein (TIRG00374 family)
MIDKPQKHRYSAETVLNLSNTYERRSRLRSWKVWIGILVSAFFVWLTVRGLEWNTFWASLRSANPWWLVPAVGIYFMAVWARTWRWHYMLRHIQPVKVRHLFPIVVIGYMGNNVYPARAGEILRSYILRKREGVSVSASLGTVALERLFDGLVMCAFVFVTLPFVPLPPLYRSIMVGFSLFFFALLVIFLLLVINPARTDQRLARLIHFFVPERYQPSARSLASTFLIGLHALRSPREVTMILLTSVAIWLTETGKYWIVSHAFPTLDVSWTSLMLMTAVVNLATTLPSAPGHIGTFDKPGIEVLKAFGQPENLAAAYTIVLHIALWLPVTLLGLYFMARESMGVKLKVQDTILKDTALKVEGRRL